LRLCLLADPGRSCASGTVDTRGDATTGAAFHGMALGV
jgi:hypothetical protein